MEFQAAILTEQKIPLVVDNITHNENLKIGQVFVELYVSGICGLNWEKLMG